MERKRRFDSTALEYAYNRYVGDDPTNDVAGALGAGMRAVWLDNEGRSYPASAPQPTHRIGALPEILALLSGQ